MIRYGDNTGQFNYTKDVKVDERREKTAKDTKRQISAFLAQQKTSGSQTQRREDDKTIAALKSNVLLLQLVTADYWNKILMVIYLRLIMAFKFRLMFVLFTFDIVYSIQWLQFVSCLINP